MADVSGHQFNRKSFDLMTESPPCNISKISIGFFTWSYNFLTEIKEGGGSYQNLAFLDHTSSYLWVELIFIVIEGVSGGRNGKNVFFYLFYHDLIAQFLPFKILIPAQIFSSLIFDRKVFQESLVASILLRHGFLNKDLTIL